ncbi:MAG: transposase [Anaerolineae bacterium]
MDDAFHRRDHELTRVKFLTTDCAPCPVRSLCTKHNRRTLSFHEQPVYEMVQQRKQEQHTAVRRERYGKQAGVRHDFAARAVYGIPRRLRRTA